MKRVRRLVTILFAAFGCVLGGETAQAAGIADVPLRAVDRAGARLALTGTASPHTHAVETHAFAPWLAIAWRVHPQLVLGLDGAASFTSYRFANQSRGGIARSANPMLSARWGLLARDLADLDIGLAAGAPLVTVPGGITANAAAEHADRAASAAAGQSAIWLWARNAVPLVFLVRGRFRIGERFDVRVAAEPALLLSVNRDGSYLAILGSVEVDVPVAPPLAAGLRVTGVASGRALDTRDHGQTSVAAVLRWEPDGPVFGCFDAVVGLDGPAGVTRHASTAWGATIAAGARF